LALVSFSLGGSKGTQEGLNPAATHRGAGAGTVSVIAFSTDGRFLGAPEISRFESEDHVNLAGRFRNGIAAGVPFGLYEVGGRLPAYYSDSARVAVYQSRVTVVLGLEFGYEGPIAPPVLRGQVLGLSSVDAKRAFVRLTSVFAHRSVESALAPDGRFELCGFSNGQYVLTAVGERGVLATRLIAIPYSLPALEVRVGEDRATGSFKR